MTLKQKKFINALAGHGNATQAVIDAGYNVSGRLSAKSIASQNLDKPAIRSALDIELGRQGLDEAVISNVISDVITNGTAGEKLRAVELLIKIRGDIQPKKSMHVSMSFKDWARQQEAQ